jgi:MFS family permease
MEHSSNFHLLLVGRVLGGISTNLLFSAFESWMTTEHRHRGFPEEWLTRTYAETSIGNGSMAIMAGIVAQVLEDYLGHIGPFQGAIALTTLALVLILQWNENYGEEKEGEHAQSSLYHQFTEGWKVTMSDSNVWRIGMTQALSEGAMYTVRFHSIVVAVLRSMYLFQCYLTTCRSTLCSVCLHVGANIVATRATGRCSYWLRLLRVDDDHYHGWSPLSTPPILYWQHYGLERECQRGFCIISLPTSKYINGDSCHLSIK